jgi:hypothetical protein
VRLVESIDIEISPDRVFGFFEQMADNYLRWHPDHQAFRWLDPEGLATGSRFSLRERIGGRELERTMVITRLQPGRMLEFAPNHRFVRFLMPRLLFRMAPIGRGACRLSAEIHVRTGPLGAWLNRREFDAVRRHMREECQNLKRIVEGDADGTVPEQIVGNGT